MIIKPTLSLSIKNLYTVLAIAAAMLYAYSLHYGQISVQNYKAGWVDRTVQYQQLDKVKDRGERTDQWNILHARDNLATDKLWTAFGNFVLMAVLGGMFALFFGGRTLLFQRREDEIQRLERDKRKLEVDQMRVDRQPLWQKVAEFFKRK